MIEPTNPTQLELDRAIIALEAHDSGGTIEANGLFGPFVAAYTKAHNQAKRTHWVTTEKIGQLAHAWQAGQPGQMQSKYVIRAIVQQLVSTIRFMAKHNKTDNLYIDLMSCLRTAITHAYPKLTDFSIDLLMGIMLIKDNLNKSFEALIVRHFDYFGYMTDIQVKLLIWEIHREALGLVPNQTTHTKPPLGDEV